MDLCSIDNLKNNFKITAEVRHTNLLAMMIQTTTVLLIMLIGAVEFTQRRRSLDHGVSSDKMKGNLIYCGTRNLTAYDDYLFSDKTTVQWKMY